MANFARIRLILELHDRGMSQDEISRSRHMSRSTITTVLRTARKKGITYAGIRKLDDAALQKLFFPDRPEGSDMYELPDYESIHKELKKPGMTLSLLWTEYRDRCHQNGNIAVGHTKFCEDYGRYCTTHDLTNHLEHKPGAQCEVDWSGPTMQIIDRDTGATISVHLFVSCLTYSRYAYVEATLDMKMDTWPRPSFLVLWRYMGEDEMSYPFFAYMSRLKYIARWGLMRSTIPENDAEHTLQTAMIAHALALIRQDIFHEPTDPEHCAMLALYHDASEVFTGDLPTPVKYFTPGLHEKYEEIETEARNKLLATLPEELQESYASYLVTLEQDPLWPLAKAADTLSAFLKCAEEVRDGNPEFQEAYRTTRKKLEDLHMKEVDWFLARFAKSFEKTLDQLNQNQ